MILVTDITMTENAIPGGPAKGTGKAKAMSMTDGAMQQVSVLKVT